MRSGAAVVNKEEMIRGLAKIEEAILCVNEIKYRNSVEYQFGALEISSDDEQEVSAHDFEQEDEISPKIEEKETEHFLEAKFTVLKSYLVTELSELRNLIADEHHMYDFQKRLPWNAHRLDFYQKVEDRILEISKLMADGNYTEAEQKLENPLRYNGYISDTMGKTLDKIWSGFVELCKFAIVGAVFIGIPLALLAVDPSGTLPTIFHTLMSNIYSYPNLAAIGGFFTGAVSSIGAGLVAAGLFRPGNQEKINNKLSFIEMKSKEICEQQTISFTPMR